MAKSNKTATVQPKKSAVVYCRPEYHEALPTWELIKATSQGEAAVKAMAEKVLPRPNPLDVSIDNQRRYSGYLTRAVFYNVAGRTLDALTGFVFQKEPKVTLPIVIANMEKNVDGSGVTLNQQAKKALRLTLGLGRCGLLADYPRVEGITTAAQLNSGKVAPTIVLYEPDQIVNWRTSVVGAQILLDLLVLKETLSTPVDDNEFELATVTQYRVLTREDGVILGRIFVPKGDDFVQDTDQDYLPQDANGQPLDTIPFVFIGADNNDSAIDSPPLIDLVWLNLAHFRNSADYEESSYMVGQPTPWIAGLTQDWVDNVLKGNVYLGSRAILPLPQGGSAGLLQADPNNLPKEAMEHKERQMLALGAKLVQPKDVQRTATEATMDNAAEVSVLSACANNVFQAYKLALTLAGQFVGTDTAKLEYTLAEPLNLVAISSDQVMAIVSLLQGELIDFEEARTQLRKGGIAYKDDKEVHDNIGAGNFDNLPPVPPAPKPKPAPAYIVPPAPQPRPTA